jgi:uncharacterized protein (TIGR03382 family)
MKSLDPRICLCLSALFLVSSARARSAEPTPEAIWIEGEAATSHDFNNHNWYRSSSVAMDLLSPGTPGGESGDWLCHFQRGEAAQSKQAVFEFETQEKGPFAIWIRANPHSPGNTFQIDGAAEQPIPRTQNREYINLHSNRAGEGGWIDIRFLDWLYLGSYALEPGSHSLTLNVHPAPQGDGNIQAHLGIDAIAIVNFDWGPAGAVQPSTETAPAPAPDAWFAFHHGALGLLSVIDRSSLVEAPAGRHGALKQVGADYAFADGTPVKFWGTGSAVPATVAAMESQALFLRRMGVNLIRLHPLQSFLGVLEVPEGGGEPVFNPDRIDRLDRYASILKAHGIYMQWSVFWFSPVTETDGYPAELRAELGERRGQKQSYGYVNSSRALQDIRWRYLEKLIGHRNPYTGMTYAEDTTLAILEVQNEDTLFSHSSLNPLRMNDAPLHAALLRRQWAEWVRARYGTDQALSTAWGAGRRDDDSVNAEELGIYGAWEFRADGPPNANERARMGDYLRFCTELQREHWTRRRAELRGIGFAGVVLGTAWFSGGPAGDLANLYADSALGTIDRHGYHGGFGNGHVRLSEFGNDTILDLERWFDADAENRNEAWKTPFRWGFQQVDDRPFAMSEWTHGAPGEFRAEGPPIYAFYGMGLQGWDASLHFAYGNHTDFSTSWDFNPTYNVALPVQMLQYPALATAVHQGHLRQGAPAATRRFSTDQAFSGLDALAHPGDSAWPGTDNVSIPPQIFALGRIANTVADGAAASERSDWSQGWNAAQKTVTANTGELRWDYGQRVIEVSAEKTQGVIGFAGGKSFDLPSVRVRVTTPFVSLLITALDDLPIDRSSRVLVTAVAREKWTGSEIEGVGPGARLVSLGGPPLMLEPVQASLRFFTAFESAQALDPQGREVGKALTPGADGTYSLDGRYATVYYLFQRTPEVEPPQPGADGGTKPPDVADSGCGCQSHSGALPFLVVLMLGLVGRRRRRAAI